MALEDFDSSDESLSPEELAAFQSAIDQLKARCSAARIAYESPSSPDELSLTVLVNAGREQRRVYIGDLQQARGLLTIPFEKFVFVGDYLAVCSYQDGFIEAAIRGLGTGGGAGYRMRHRLFGSASGEELDAEDLTIPIEAPVDLAPLKVQVRPTPTTLGAFSPRAQDAPTLVAEGLRCRTNEEAIDVLETLADALFFEIDVRYDLAIGLLRDRRPLQRPGLRNRVSRDKVVFPASRFDKEPASLYWYGRSSTGLPLLQFLAYYQCIEYYFPVYSQREAIRRVRNVIKDPAFDPHDDTQVTRLLSTAQASRGGVLGDERSQLRATVQECLDPSDLRMFLTSDPTRAEFYSSKFKAVSTAKVSLANPNADLRNDSRRTNIRHSLQDRPHKDRIRRWRGSIAFAVLQGGRHAGF